MLNESRVSFFWFWSRFFCFAQLSYLILFHYLNPWVITFHVLKFQPSSCKAPQVISKFVSRPCLSARKLILIDMPNYAKRMSRKQTLESSAFLLADYCLPRQELTFASKWAGITRPQLKTPRNIDSLFSRDSILTHMHPIKQRKVHSILSNGAEICTPHCQIIDLSKCVPEF